MRRYKGPKAMLVCPATARPSRRLSTLQGSLGREALVRQRNQRPFPTCLHRGSSECSCLRSGSLAHLDQLVSYCDDWGFGMLCKASEVLEVDQTSVGASQSLPDQ